MSEIRGSLYPEEILKTFQKLRKVIIWPSGRSLDWMRYLPRADSLEIYDWNGEAMPNQWTGGENYLTRLYLRTKTGEFPALLRHLRALRQLGLDSSPGSELELPTWLPSLNRLERIYLRNCRIKSIPESLWRDTELPFIVDDVKRDRGIFLYGSSLTGMEGLEIKDFETPDESRMSDPAYQKARNKAHGKINRYYKLQNTSEADKESQTECMVIFLGDGSTGKTSLIERLIDRAKEFKIGESLPTNGVKMTLWPTKIGEKDYHLRVLDFGGQEIMHSIHRCFMTDYTVYVVVCESRADSELDSNVVRWMETIRTFAPDSPVILALNKADTNPQVSVNERDFTGRYPMLKKVLKTTALSDPKYAGEFPLDRLEEAIKEQAEKCASQILAKKEWFEVRQELEALRDMRGTLTESQDSVGGEEESEEKEYSDLRGNYIIRDDYKDICTRHGITSAEEQREMLDWFRELGVVYSYEDSENGEIDPELEGVRVLNREWLSNGIYRIILHAPINTFLTHQEIRNTLKTVFDGDVINTKYIVRKVRDVPSEDGKDSLTEFDEPRFIIHVMRKFDLSTRANVRKEDGSEEKCEMIPTRFTRNAPKTRDYFPDDEALHIQWVGQYLPNNVIHRLIIRRYQQLDRDCVWRTGGRFLVKKENGVAGGFRAATEADYEYQALVTLNDLGLDLFVSKNPNLRKYIDLRTYLDDLRNEILAIMKEMRLDPQEFPCFRQKDTGREVKLSLQESMMWLRDKSYDSDVRAFARYTTKESGDATQVGEFLYVRDSMNKIYPDFSKMVRDFREQADSPDKTAPPVPDENSEKSSVADQIRHWVESKPLLRDMYYALSASTVYVLLTLLAICVLIGIIIYAFSGSAILYICVSVVCRGV